uniref:Uncharacterized protein LOC108037860 n=1 Tax=Drosophila rhopaloa TaxID=1041015 RepID=A0A6P4E430_DRORH
MLFIYLNIHKKVRTARDTSNIPTHLFKPVGRNSNNDKVNERSSFINSNGTTLSEPEADDEGIQFLERASGEVEEVTSSYEDEDVRPRQFQRPQPRPYYPQNSPRNNGFPIQNSPNGFQPDYSQDPSGRFRGGNGFNSRPFPSSPNFGSRNIGPFPEPEFGGQNTPTWVSRPIPVPLSSSMIPLFSGGSSNFGQSGPIGPIGPIGKGRPIGPIGSGSSSNNFFRTESYSYSSDGRGPPQIERDVYDSRDRLGASFRNF